ncbi:MAG: ACP S-malonyltransferase [Planctomycetes bacterium]|nr:ACP S-malonyltransferase [Planctomycetota bacterium]
MTGLLFPGQGAQHVAMGLALAEQYKSAREVFTKADALLGIPLSRYCFEGPLAELTRTDVSQPAIFVTSLAALAALEESSPFRRAKASMAAGLSLGEYTALCAAGSITFDDGLRLVRLRGEAMQAASEAKASSMSAVLGLGEAGIEEACAEARAAGIVSIANKNAPGQIVISGELAALEAAEKACTKRGAKRCIRLNVAGAFHSEVMRPAADRLQRALANVEIREPAVPFYSNVTGARVRDPEAVRGNLAKQVCATVLWEASMRAAIADGEKHFIELAPGTSLAGMLRKIDADAAVQKCEDPADITKIAADAN